MKRRKPQSEKERRRHMTEYVLGYLDRRWRHKTGPEGLTKKHRQWLVKQDHFQAMVDTAMEQNGTLSLPDLDLTPEVRRLRDGELRSLLIEELGMDPALFRCADCGDEIDPGSQRRCDPCHEWRTTGVRP